MELVQTSFSPIWLRRISRRIEVFVPRLVRASQGDNYADRGDCAHFAVRNRMELVQTSFSPIWLRWISRRIEFFCIHLCTPLKVTITRIGAIAPCWQPVIACGTPSHRSHLFGCVGSLNGLKFMSYLCTPLKVTITRIGAIAPCCQSEIACGTPSHRSHLFGCVGGPRE